MDFRFVQNKKGADDNVSVPRKTVEEVIDLLKHVDCTAVYSEKHKEYFAVKDVNQEIVKELEMALSLSKLIYR